MLLVDSCLHETAWLSVIPETWQESSQQVSSASVQNIM